MQHNASDVGVGFMHSCVAIMTGHNPNMKQYSTTQSCIIVYVFTATQKTFYIL